jgi:hypothetical protein
VVASIVLSIALATAQGPLLQQVGPAKFDVAGVRLGMSPDEVRQALTKADYRIDPPAKLEGFRGEVAARIAEIRHQSRTASYDAVAGMSARRPSAEHVTVEFRQWPDGPHVVRVAFTGNALTEQQESFRAQVEGRFGKPTMHVLGGWRWCSAGERQCGPAANSALPALDADYQSRTLTLSIGTEATEARKALVEAEARKVVPLQGGSAF